MQAHFIKFHDKIKLGRKDSEYKKAREKDDSITDAIKSAFKDKGYPVIDNFIQGSLATHTAIKNKNEDFDIDRALVIDSEKAPDDPVEPKKVILDVLENRGFKNAKIKTPCVTADYMSENLHIDFPLYRKESDTYELAIGKKNSKEENKHWSDSDPKGLLAWIKNDDSYGLSKAIKRCQFYRSVRYIKRWRDEKFKSCVAKKIYSIGLTVMLKECFEPILDDDGKPDDLVSLKKTISMILDRSYFIPQGNDKYRVQVCLPTSPYRDIFDGSSVDTATQLRNKFVTLKNKLQDVIDKADEVKKCEILKGLFGDDFEIPEENNSSTTGSRFSRSGVVGTSQGA